MAQVGAGYVPSSMPLKLVHSLWVIHQHITLYKVQEVPQELQHYIWVPVFLWRGRIVHLTIHVKGKQHCS